MLSYVHRLHVLALLAAAVALAPTGVSAETVLLNFTASWCGPCKQVAPAVDQLAAAGYPVRKVDVDQHRDLAAEHQVTSVPTFVLLVNGREADRLVGAAEHQRLEQMLRGGGVTPIVARGQSPDEFQPLDSLPARQASDGAVAADPQLIDRLTRATVRLKVKDAGGFSNGSGTIIDTHGQAALVLTCGHIFRESQGQGEITIDLFGSDGAKDLPARLIHYDLDRDVALVSFKPGVETPVARVAPAGHTVQSGDRIINIGCDAGAAPTVKLSHVTAVNKFLGPPHVMVAGQPVQGRSGGGLFDEHGAVIGVCNAADPEQREGLYAAIGSIHAVLDEAKLSFIYQDQSKPADGDFAKPADSASPPPPQRFASAAQPASFEENVDPGEPTAAEVVCIVRTPGAESEVIVINDASPELLERLLRERSPTSSRQATMHRQ